MPKALANVQSAPSRSAEHAMPAACQTCLLRIRPIFRQFSSRELRFVAEMKQGHVWASAGTELLDRHHRNEVYTLHEGWAMRYRRLPDGQRQILDFVLPGDMIGLNASLLGISTHSVVALTRVSLCVLDSSRIGRLFREQPELALSMLKGRSQEQERADLRMLAVGRMNGPQRVAHLLLELNERLSDRGLAARGCFELPVTAKQIADAIGMSRVHVMRALRELRERKLAHIEAGTVHIPNVRKLAKYGNFVGGPASIGCAIL